MPQYRVSPFDIDSLPIAASGDVLFGEQIVRFAPVHATQGGEVEQDSSRD
jgi:hypothetical protein